MTEQTKELDEARRIERERTEGATPGAEREGAETAQIDEGPELVVQELFFEDYATPLTTVEELNALEQPEQKGVVKRVVKGVMLGIVMLGSLVFAGILFARHQRPAGRFAALRERFVH